MTPDFHNEYRGLGFQSVSDRAHYLIQAFRSDVFRPLSSARPLQSDNSRTKNSHCVRLGQIDINLLSQESAEQQAALQTSNRRAAIWRTLEIILTVLAILVVIPLFVLTAFAVAVSSPGPIFYIQERVGAQGRPFQLIKFRSMRVNAEDGGAQWATCHDPRVTSVGRFLRLTRFDELPQLFNVLEGSMSLIGPRPERPIFVEQLRKVIPHFDDRTLIRPGITGWAQVNYRYCASVEDAREKLAYDLYYLRYRSAWLNLKIILLTIGVMCSKAGSR